MSKEITYTANLSFAKGALTAFGNLTNATADMAGSEYVRQSMSVPTTSGGTAPYPWARLAPPAGCGSRIRT